MISTAVTATVRQMVSEIIDLLANRLDFLPFATYKCDTFFFLSLGL